MKTNKDHNAAARSIFMSSIEWLANIGAVAVTFFLTPLAYNASMGGSQNSPKRITASA